MSKALLTDVLKESIPQLTAAEASDVAARVLAALSGAIVAGGALTLHGLGHFTVRQQEPRAVKHPVRDERIQVPARASVKFKPSKALLEALNRSELAAVGAPKRSTEA